MRGFITSATLLALCACSSAPRDVADGGPIFDAGGSPDASSCGPFLTYTFIDVNCTPCNLNTLVAEVVGMTPVNCGMTSDWFTDAGDAAVARCVAEPLDAGAVFVAYRQLRGIDSTVTAAFTRDDAGMLREIRHDIMRTCMAGANVRSCADLGTSDGGITCEAPTDFVRQCSERESRREWDAGQRPISELRCQYGTYCRADASAPGDPPDSGAPMVCSPLLGAYLLCSGSIPACRAVMPVTFQDGGFQDGG